MDLFVDLSWVAIFLVIMLLLIWRADRIVTTWIRLEHEREQQRELNRHDEKQAAIDLQRRQAKIDEITAEDQAAFKAAELRKQAAEADAAAEVIAATVEDRITAEREVIAAAARGRAARAEQDAISPVSEIDITAALRVLADANTAYNKRVNNSQVKTFAEWVGTVNVRQLLGFP